MDFTYWKTTLTNTMTILIDYSSIATLKHIVLFLRKKIFPPKIGSATWHQTTKHTTSNILAVSAVSGCSSEPYSSVTRPQLHRHLQNIWELKAYSPKSDPIRWVWVKWNSIRKSITQLLLSILIPKLHKGVFRIYVYA